MVNVNIVRRAGTVNGINRTKLSKIPKSYNVTK